MICDSCNGKGLVSAAARPLPCQECGGTGIVHCCDGLQEQPGSGQRPHGTTQESGMRNAPIRLDEQTRVYVRVALRDTIEAYDLTDLLDLMADICTQNADISRTGGQLGLPAAAWELRSDVLREAAQKLDEAARP